MRRRRCCPPASVAARSTRTDGHDSVPGQGPRAAAVGTAANPSSDGRRPHRHGCRTGPRRGRRGGLVVGPPRAQATTTRTTHQVRGVPLPRCAACHRRRVLMLFWDAHDGGAFLDGSTGKTASVQRWPRPQRRRQAAETLALVGRRPQRWPTAAAMTTPAATTTPVPTTRSQRTALDCTVSPQSFLKCMAY